jgi:hypothetical protein
MIIQFFLTLLLLAIAAAVVLQQITSRLVRVVILCVLGLGVFFVWVPDVTTDIAAALGVGRGADLVLYLWVVITLALLVVMYLKIIRMGRRITQLTRAIALGSVRRPQGDGMDT